MSAFALDHSRLHLRPLNIPDDGCKPLVQFQLIVPVLDDRVPTAHWDQQFGGLDQ